MVGKSETFDLYGPGHVNPKGIGMITCALFLIGEMAGAGIVAMPKAMLLSNWGGVGLLLIGAVASGYTGWQLGQCWQMVQTLYPVEYKDKCRKPYPAIAQRALEPYSTFWMKFFKVATSICIDSSLFGATAVYILLAAENISNLLSTYGNDDFSFCYLIPIFVAFMIPITLLGTPADFWPISVGAMGTSSIAGIGIIVGSILDKSSHAATRTYPAPTVLGFFSGYAKITFAYGGHSAFPTMQHDMKKPADFSKSVTLTYIIIAMLYFPVAVSGFVCYGNYGAGIHDNIIQDIGTSWIRTLIILCITAHVICSITISINVVNLDIEDLFGIPHKFGVQRVILRSCLMLLALFVVETVPKFGILLDLIGGTAITCLTFIFPCLYYLLLRRTIDRQSNPIKNVEPYYAKSKDQERISVVSKFSDNDLREHERANPTVYGNKLKKWEIIVNVIIITIGVIAGVSSLYGTITELIDSFKFSPPCYLNITAADNDVK